MKSFLIALFLCFSNIALAQNLKIKLLSGIDSGLKSQVLNDLQSNLPLGIKLEKNKTIKIKFTSLESRKILTNYCHSKSGYKLARLSFKGKTTILIDSQFKDIIRNKKTEVKGECFYKTRYDLLIGTLIHEIAHVYDYNFKINSITTETAYRRSVRRENSFDTGIYHRKKKMKLSRLPEFETVSSFNDGSLFFSSHEYEFSNSPNTHEFTNSKEKFAVQLEFFAMDSNYKCREPNLYHYFTKTLGLTPQYQSNCRTNSHVFTEDTKRKIELKNIFEAQLFISLPHKESTPWGHSALLLKKCGSELVQGRCVEDKFEEIIVDYSMDAIIDFGKSDVINALLGNFNVRSKIREKGSYMEQFISHEGREFFFMKLKMNTHALKRLTNQIIKDHWNLWTPYVLYGNNCTHLVAQLLKIAKEDYSWNLAKILTPEGLLNDAISRNYTNENTGHNRSSGKIDKSNGFIEKAWAQIKKLNSFSYFEDYNQFLQETTPSERVSLYEDEFSQNPNNKFKLISSGIVLEKYLIGGIESNIPMALEMSSQIEKKQIVTILNQMKKIKRKSLSWNLVQKGLNSYGIPLSSEIVSSDEFNSRIDEFNQSQKSLVLLVKEIIESNNKDFAESRKLIKSLINLMKK